MRDYKLARTNDLGYDSFLILSDGLMDQEEKKPIQDAIFEKYGEVTIFNVSSKPGEKEVWVTNKHGVKRERHDDLENLDFDFILFKDPKEFLPHPIQES